MDRSPSVSVIVPVHNGEAFLEKCLAAIKTSSCQPYEILVVDDASTDGSPRIAEKEGATVIRLRDRSGPAAARNVAARQAKGDLLLFIDSDVLIREDTIARVIAHFSSRPDLSALFGSYDRSPAAPNFISQYKNLIHHFVHQQSNPDAVTFWAGCGAVRRDVFEGLGGFDEVRYKKPCIEDIELGYRLKRIGLDIFLDKELQVKHLKEWRIGSLMRADIFSRAVPWTRLILERQGMISDLNLQASQRISAGLVGLMAAGLAFSFLDLRLILLSFSLLTAVMVINRKLLMFFAAQRGFLFAAGAFAMQLIYYFYSGMTFVLLYLMDRVQRRRRGARSLRGVMRGDKEELKNATTSK